MRPIHFASLIETLLTQHQIEVVQVKVNRSTQKVLELTSVRGIKAVATHIDWFLVEQAFDPGRTGV